MNIIEQNDQRLVLREVPALFWFNAVLFLTIGTVLVFGEQAFKVGLPLVAIGLALAVAPAIRTVVLERATTRVIIWRRNLFWKRSQAIPFAEVCDVEVYSPTRVKSIVMLNLVLAGNKRLTLADGTRRDGFAPLAEIMRAYLKNS